MYLVNYLNLQAAQQLFISVGRFRTGVELIGAKDGINHTFFVPGGEKFTHNLPFLSIALYVNGIRMTLLDDYVIAESEGPGTGFDIVTLGQALYSNDHLTADYVVT